MKEKSESDIQQTIRVLKGLRGQLEELAKAKIEESSKEVTRYLAILEAEKRKRRQ
jgi:hypothetical protein